MTLAQRIASAVRTARESAGLTQAQLSARCGVLVPHISRLESGRAVPKLETVEKVFAALGLTLEIVTLARKPRKPGPR